MPGINDFFANGKDDDDDEGFGIPLSSVAAHVAPVAQQRAPAPEPPRRPPAAANAPGMPSFGNAGAAAPTLAPPPTPPPARQTPAPAPAPAASAVAQNTSPPTAPAPAPRAPTALTNGAPAVDPPQMTASRGGPPPALAAVREDLSPEDRAFLAEMMLDQGIPEDHPVFTVFAEFIKQSRRNHAETRELVELMSQTADKIRASGRIIKFTLSPQMSVGVLVLAIGFFFAIAWTGGAVVTAAHIHETAPLYPLVGIIALAIGIVIGTTIHPYSSRTVEQKKQTKPSW